MGKKQFFGISLVTLLLYYSSPAFANALNISNVSFASKDTVADTITVQFDVTWSNSWRDNVNYDATWIFLKYSTDEGTTWNHANLSASGLNPAGFSQGSGTAVDILAANDKKGCFVQRSGNGTGTLTTTGLKIVWNYGNSGVSDSADAQIKIFGIEMVYIPQGSFYVGDGTTSNVTGQFTADDTTGSFQITSEGALTLGGTTTGNLGNNNVSGMYTADDFDNSTTQSLVALFPKGYNAFYLMKYEITEGQWVEFFNTLTSAQKTTRDITSATGKNSDAVVTRNTVSWTSGDATTIRPDRDCHFLNWMDSAAYIDWAALRPITELEFEKACRGPNTPIANEYAWGSTSITEAATISGTENGTENITTSNANALITGTFTGVDGGSGYLRAGIFATSSSTRVSSGSGYYGNMELSGSLYDLCVSVGNSTGRAFTGSHGDGVLTTTSSYEGNATNTDWPGIDGTSSRGVTGASGAGFRGGATTTRARTSDRVFAVLNQTTRGGFAARGARTAST